MKKGQHNGGLPELDNPNGVLGYISTNADSFDGATRNLYKDKIQTILREYSSNAKDAMIRSKRAGHYLVFLPSKDNLFVAFRDRGLGLNKERMIKYFMGFYESEGRFEEKTNGSWGLGAKSALAYVDGFYVRTKAQGKYACYHIYRNSKGFPEMVEIEHKDLPKSAHVDHEEGAEWKSGLEVMVPVKEEDVESFCVKAPHILKWHQATFKLLGHSASGYMRIPVEMGIAPFAEVSPSLFSTNKSSLRQNVYVWMGDNAYPVASYLGFGGVYRKASRMGLTQEFVNYFLSLGHVIRAPLGAVTLLMSREDLEYSEKTIETLETSVLSGMVEFVKSIYAIFDVDEDSSLSRLRKRVEASPLRPFIEKGALRTCFEAFLSIQQSDELVKKQAYRKKASGDLSMARYLRILRNATIYEESSGGRFFIPGWAIKHPRNKFSKRAWGVVASIMPASLYQLTAPHSGNRANRVFEETLFYALERTPFHFHKDPLSKKARKAVELCALEPNDTVLENNTVFFINGSSFDASALFFHIDASLADDDEVTRRKYLLLRYMKKNSVPRLAIFVSKQPSLVTEIALKELALAGLKIVSHADFYNMVAEQDLVEFDDQRMRGDILSSRIVDEVGLIRGDDSAHFSPAIYDADGDSLQGCMEWGNSKIYAPRFVAICSSKTRIRWQTLGSENDRSPIAELLWRIPTELKRVTSVRHFISRYVFLFLDSLEIYEDVMRETLGVISEDEFLAELSIFQGWGEKICSLKAEFDEYLSQESSRLQEDKYQELCAQWAHGSPSLYLGSIDNLALSPSEKKVPKDALALFARELFFQKQIPFNDLIEVLSSRGAGSETLRHVQAYLIRFSRFHEAGHKIDASAFVHDFFAARDEAPSFSYKGEVLGLIPFFESVVTLSESKNSNFWMPDTKSLSEGIPFNMAANACRDSGFEKSVVLLAFDFIAKVERQKNIFIRASALPPLETMSPQEGQTQVVDAEAVDPEIAKKERKEIMNKLGVPSASAPSLAELSEINAEVFSDFSVSNLTMQDGDKEHSISTEKFAVALKVGTETPQPTLWKKIKTFFS